MNSPVASRIIHGFNHGPLDSMSPLKWWLSNYAVRWSPHLLLPPWARILTATAPIGYWHLIIRGGLRGLLLYLRGVGHTSWRVVHHRSIGRYLRDHLKDMSVKTWTKRRTRDVVDISSEMWLRETYLKLNRLLRIVYLLYWCTVSAGWIVVDWPGRIGTLVVCLLACCSKLGRIFMNP